MVGAGATGEKFRSALETAQSRKAQGAAEAEASSIQGFHKDRPNEGCPFFSHAWYSYAEAGPLASVVAKDCCAERRGVKHVYLPRSSEASSVSAGGRRHPR